MPAPSPAQRIVAHYEACLARHGDSHLGVDWPDADDARTRYRVMLDVIKPGGSEPPTLLDFGCGASHLYQYLRDCGRADQVAYAGADLSAAFVELSRKKFPDLPYYCGDVLEDPSVIPISDYIVANGTFTERRDVPFDEMFEYVSAVVERLFTRTRIGLAFNVMSPIVDWERDDLFHVPFDRMARMVGRLSRCFAFRQDYGLREYTTYIYRS